MLSFVYPGGPGVYYKLYQFDVCFVIAQGLGLACAGESHPQNHPYAVSDAK